jgi:cytoskeleton protein RodZ
MELHEIGTLLRHERQKQGLSLEEVGEKTKISRRIISAIENGEEGRLPHPVYAKGFVKSYAGLLGLDPEQIGCDFSSAYGVQEEGCRKSGDRSVEEQFTPPRRTAALILVFAVMLLTLGAMTLFFMSTGPEAPDTALQTETPTAHGPAPAPAPESPRFPAPLPEEEAAPIPDRESEYTPHAIDPTETLPQESSSPKIADQVQPQIENVVEIMADQACWVQARVDGRRVERLLRPGQSMSLTYTSALSVRLGNAGGVRIRSNGEPYPLNGQPGEVRALTFP